MTLAERIKDNLDSLTAEHKQILDDAIAYDIEHRGVSYVVMMRHIDGVEYDDMRGAVIHPNFAEKVAQYLRNQGMEVYRGKNAINEDSLVVTLN